MEKGAGGKKVYRITEEIRIEGKIQKPEAFFFYQKSTINYDWQELKQDFIPKILDSVSHRRSEHPSRPTARSKRIEHHGDPGSGPTTDSRSRPPKLKILRIGIIQGGRIVEERLVRKRENITIGQSAKNMFVVLSDALPRNWLLFEVSGNGYVAHFSDGMDARIAVGNEIISLSQLKQTGKIQKRGASWVLPLDERSRGKITLADMTILFQFVTPPPPQPRPQLPASVRGSALTGRRLVLHDHRRDVVPAPPDASSSTCATSTGRASPTSRRSPIASCRWW